MSLGVPLGVRESTGIEGTVLMPFSSEPVSPRGRQRPSC
jgi:hypothetical protein